MAILIIFFVFGTVFGSFGSVFLQRMDKKITLPILKSFVYGRSQCPHCHRTLHAHNLIPLFSWFHQKGKCEYCKVSISTIYPVLEIVSGLSFLLRGMIYRGDISAGLWDYRTFCILALRRLLWLMLVWDMYTYELHIPAWFVSLMVALIYGWVLAVQWSRDRHIVWSSIWFLMIFMAVYLFGKWYAKIRFGVAKEAFGQWDVMLAPLLGYLFAVQGIGGISFFSQQFMMFMLFFLLGSSIIGLFYYSIVIGLHKIYRKIDLPDTTHETWTPMIPFLPSMIVMYRCIVLWSAFV
jgi:prepilin signal peptidase PulO-like enzyme (type II secretory pathway)